MDELHESTSSCGSSRHSYTWGYDGTATSAQEAAVEAAFEFWERGRDLSGNSLVSFTGPNTGTVDIEVEVTGTPGGDSDNNGYSSCGSQPRVEIRNDHSTSSPNVFRDVAQHEIGHLLGLTHSGTEDNVQSSAGSVPIMSTCAAPGADRQYTNDDRAALQLTHSTYTIPLMSGNPGFEFPNDPDSGWSGANAVVQATTDHFAGDWAIRFRDDFDPSGGTPLFQQSIGFYDGIYGYDTNGRNIDGRVWYKTPTTSASGNAVGLKIYYRRYTYPSLAASGCASSATRWPFGRDGTSRSSTNVWVRARTEYGGTVSNWTYLEEQSPWSTGSQTFNRDGLDLKIRLWSYIVGNDVFVDSMSLRDRG